MTDATKPPSEWADRVLGPCRCTVDYTSRNMTDPQCSRCDGSEEELALALDAAEARGREQGAADEREAVWAGLDVTDEQVRSILDGLMQTVRGCDPERTEDADGLCGCARAIGTWLTLWKQHKDAAIAEMDAQRKLVNRLRARGPAATPASADECDGKGVLGSYRHVDESTGEHLGDERVLCPGCPACAEEAPDAR